MKILIVFLTVLLICSSSAQIPRTLSYQGVLTDANGTPMADNNYTVTFRLYNVASGGTSFWSEQKIVSVRRGLFSTNLGDQNLFTASVKFDQPYYLSLQVGSSAELAQRLTLTAAPYSFRSIVADSARVSGSGGAGTGIQRVQNTNSTLDVTSPDGPTAIVNVKVPLSLTSSTGNAVINATNTGSTQGNAVSGTSATGIGIYGVGSQGTGVEGDGQIGVSGVHTPTTGTAAGVWGNTNSTEWGSLGVFGSSSAGFGVEGDGQIGVVGRHLGTTGTNAGVYGESRSTDFNAVGVEGIDLATSGYTAGIIGHAEASPIGTGVGGFGGARGGYFSASAGTTNGIYGVEGTTTNGYAGVYGNGGHNGVYGQTSSTTDAGVYGHNANSGNGVLGTSDQGIGVTGVANAASQAGVLGSSRQGTGVYGDASQAGQAAVYGINTSSEGNSGSLGGSVYRNISGGLVRCTAGVSGDAGPPGGVSNRYGVYGLARTTGEIAGFFDGQVVITTDLLVIGSKSFMIDHPLDPLNKYLFHSCIESDDRMNIYNGNITTDENGNATVELPSYFEALNRDYRYQLTVVGETFAQARINRKISGNHFSLKTDKPNIEISWQVTGIRQDAYAKAHPMIVEQEKPSYEKGTYTHPELYGLPPRSSSIMPATNVPVKSAEKK